MTPARMLAVSGLRVSGDSMMDNKLIVLAGATGNLGGRLARALLHGGPA